MLRLSTFVNDVLGTLLSGVSTATNSAIAATDSILVALGKLQAQLTAEVTARNNAVQGATTIAVAAGTTTPSAATFAAYGIISFTGTLTAAAIVIVPNTGRWTLLNNTTGAYTLQVTTAAGSGIYISQGQSMDVLANGTNVTQTVSDLYVSPVFSGAPTRSVLLVGDNSTALATSNFVYQATQSYINKGLAGGTNTLASNVTFFAQIALSGALTSNAIVVLPNAGQWTFSNITTGAFTVALKTAAQTVPLYLAQGASLRVIANNTNVIPADSDFQNSPLSPANCTGRNLLQNGLFNVQQRGLGPITVAGYLADRWVANNGKAGGTRSIAIAAASDASRLAIGDEACEWTLNYTFTGGTAAGDYDLLQQKLEDLYRYSNKTVTVSFWAIATSGTPKIGVGFNFQYGTGGSPTATLNITATAVQTTGSWAKYSVTMTLPSVAGKTLGTNLDSCLALNLWLSAGSTNTAIAGSIGSQTGAVSLWGLQLELGPTVTPLEKRPLADEQRYCNRYYYTNYGRVDGYGPAGGQINTDYWLPVQMRAAPTTTLPSPTYGNASAMGVSTVTAQLMILTCTVTAVGTAAAQSLMTLSAEQ